MNTPKVTIAVSVYNVEQFVRASMDCIVNQTMHDIEILCIDDASTDGTWKILQEYADKDSRIQIFRQDKNYGLSVSRNKAIELANGEYLIMLDGDDIFALDMVEKAYNKAIETHADMVLWDYCVFYDEVQLKSIRRQQSTLIGISADDKIALLRRPAFIWTKLLKTSTIRDLNIKFTPGLTKQDIPIHWQLITSLKNIVILPERLSYYRQQPNSTTNRRGRSLFSLAKVMDITSEYLHDNGLYEKYRDEFLRSRLTLLHGMFDSIKKEYKNEALTIVLDRIDADAKEYLSSSRCELSFRCKDFYGMLFGNFLSKIRYKSFLGIRSVYRFLKKD